MTHGIYDFPSHFADSVFHLIILKLFFSWKYNRNDMMMQLVIY